MPFPIQCTIFQWQGGRCAEWGGMKPRKHAELHRHTGRQMMEWINDKRKDITHLKDIIEESNPGPLAFR